MGNISEKQLEDWICKHPEDVFGSGAEIIGRQIPLPHGKLDLLIYHKGWTYVAELKARPLKEQDVGQVWRYHFDVADQMSYVGMREGPDVLNGERSPPGREIFDQHILWATNNWTDLGKGHGIRCYLIGCSIDERTKAAAGATDTLLKLWSFDGRFHFQRIDKPLPGSYPLELAWWAEELRDRIILSAAHNQELFEKGYADNE